MSASSSRSHVSSSRSPWNRVAWTSACSASRVLRMFSRMRRKKPRRSSTRSSCGAGVGPAPLVMKRSNQSLATGTRENRAMPDEITVRAEAADSLIAVRLVDAMVTEMEQLYSLPAGTGLGTGAPPSDFAPPSGAFLVIYSGGKPVAGGGVKRDEDG